MGYFKPMNFDKRPKNEQKLAPWWILAAAIIIGAAILAYAISKDQETAPEAASLPQVARLVEEGRIERLTVRGNLLIATRDDGTSISAYKETSLSAFEALQLLGASADALVDVPIVVEQTPEGFSLGQLLPWLLLIFFGFILFRGWQQMKSGSSGNNFNGIGRSNPRIISNTNGKDTKVELPHVTFKDVAGAENATFELQEIVEFLKDSAKFTKLGARVPKGVLMAGPPGTGKTLLAKAVAGEAAVPFFSISGSEFVEMFVGVGASRVRDLFKRAREHSPAIIFVDEIDAVGRHRGASIGNGNDEREQTLNQILVEMDGFGTDTKVIVIAATNRPDILDPALMRPGRFDRKVILDRPDVAGREAILQVHTKGKPLGPDISVSALARLTPGFVGADLENLVNEAAILAARRNLSMIGQAEFQDAMERIIAGPERHGKLLSQKEQEVIAFHEAGHAVVMHHLEHCDPVHKVSIVSRGMALGYTMPLPEGDKYLRVQAAFEDEIVGLLGGRAAEEIIFDRVTTGAANDLERATKLARAMVTRYGFSQRLGLRTFGEEQGNQYLGNMGEVRNYSEEMAQMIDQEIHTILNASYKRAKEVIGQNRHKLNLLASALLAQETLERSDFEALMV